MLRFALAPTRDMHMDDMRIALINFVIARRMGEQFILRIEDSNKEQNIQGKDQEIQDILKKFAIEQDQLFYQSDNLGRHQQLAMSLLESDKAFICICTPDEPDSSEYRADRCSGKCTQHTQETLSQIKEQNSPYVVRISEPDEAIVFVDQIQGEVSTKPSEIDSFVILRADGTPTADFATACDDMMNDISIVIRSEAHISTTPREIHIQRSLGYAKSMQYAHLPIILNKVDKMTDRDDTNSIKWMLEQGFLLDTIINYLLLIGNSTPQDVFTLPDAIEWLELERLTADPCMIDIEKLRFLNTEHLSGMDDKSLSKIFGFADADIGKLLKLHLVKDSTIDELDIKIRAIFAPKDCSTEYGERMRTIAEVIRTAPMIRSFDDFKQYIIQKSALDEDSIEEPLQVLMTGFPTGLELADIYPLISPYITEIARCES